MKTRNLFLFAIICFGLNSCLVGDTDDRAIQYETTLIEVLCQTPNLSTFCSLIYLTAPLQNGLGEGQPSMAWKLQFAGRNGICPSKPSVETVFAPTNQAFDEFFTNHPQWDDIFDIPQDTVDIIVKHHIFDQAKLINNVVDPTECNVQELVGGSGGVDMLFGRWTFLEANGNFIANSETFPVFTSTPIVSPDTSSTDGVVYQLEDVLVFFP